MLRKVKTKNGWVEGIPAADPRITAFKGIPFAAPPVGELRWRAPQPVKDWEGILKCDTFGPLAMQGVPGEGDPEQLYNKEWHVDNKIPMSEDCLYLNVWTPAKSANEKLPVMFWIFGGGLQCGYPSEMEFDGERIARRGVILVSVNYRLNVFGFFAHPEIGTAPNEPNCNFGFLDQLAGMKWVKENISAFGGDADNVTIFGQSAGAGSVMAHLTSPMSSGLFHKAIPQSGGGFSPGFNQGYRTLEEAQLLGKRFTDWLGAASIQEARELPSKYLFEKAAEFSAIDPEPADTAKNSSFATIRFKLFWGPCVDNEFLPLQPVEVMKSGKWNNVPMIAGNTINEFVASPLVKNYEELEAYAKFAFPDTYNEYLSIIKEGTYSFEECIKNAGYNSFELGNVLMLYNNSMLGGAPAYFYRFNPEMPGDNNGSFHSSELWFTFETLAKCWRPFKGKHYDLARHMCNYWTNFAKTGNPNGNDNDGTPMPQWKPFTVSSPDYMYFGDIAELNGQPLGKLMDFLVNANLGSK